MFLGTAYRSRGHFFSGLGEKFNLKQAIYFKIDKLVGVTRCT